MYLVKRVEKDSSDNQRENIYKQGQEAREELNKKMMRREHSDG